MASGSRSTHSADNHFEHKFRFYRRRADHGTADPVATTKGSSKREFRSSIIELNDVGGERQREVPQEEVVLGYESPAVPEFDYHLVHHASAGREPSALCTAKRLREHRRSIAAIVRDTPYSRITAPPVR